MCLWISFGWGAGLETYSFSILSGHIFLTGTVQVINILHSSE
ncbi:MAG: hypothetical protein ACI92I_000595 [Acidimicrobiales bacterium]|jgi:hypothetical protein